MRIAVNDMLNSYFHNNVLLIDGLQISVNGKINGRDRSINHLIYKYYKDMQISKLY
jgi:hypothetical protein